MMRKGLEGTARSRAGSSMVTVVILLGTMTVLALIFLRAGQAVSEEQLTNVDGARAAYLAEAGISEALEAMRNGESGAIASGNTPAYLGGGVVWVEATDLGNGPDAARLDGHEGRRALGAARGDRGRATGASSSPACVGWGRSLLHDAVFEQGAAAQAERRGRQLGLVARALPAPGPQSEGHDALRGQRGRRLEQRRRPARHGREGLRRRAQRTRQEREPRRHRLRVRLDDAQPGLGAAGSDHGSRRRLERHLQCRQQRHEDDQTRAPTTTRA
jgi:hypothetical protein